MVATIAGCSPEPIDTPGSSKIGFIFVGERDDLGYNQATWEASEAVARAFPDSSVLRRQNVPETPAAARALEELIDDGATVLFATSYGHLPYAFEVARRHPDVIVLHQGGVEPTPGLANFGTYWGAVYEPVYLAGIAAGAASRSGHLGYVVAFPIPATYNNVNAFTLGARSVNPKIRTSVVFTRDWCDPAAQARASRRLIALGADVLAQHQDCTRTILETAERSGVASVGYHYDGSEVARKGWLAGAVWDWRALFIAMVRQAQSGRFAGSAFDGDFVGSFASANNPFVLTEPGPLVPAPTAATIRNARARLERGASPFDGPVADTTGAIRIPAGLTPTHTQILSMDWFVSGVEDRTSS